MIMHSVIMVGNSFLFLFIISCTLSEAAVIGDYSKTRHLPGYIETDTQSSFFRGAVSKKQFQDGIERRTPSELIVSFFNGETLDATKIQALLDQMSKYLDAFLLVECQNEIQSTDATQCSQNDEFQKKWKKNAHYISLNFIQNNLKQVIQKKDQILLSEINHPKNANTLELLFSALDLWESLKAEDYQLSRLPPTIQLVSRLTSLPKRAFVTDQGRTEASNLLVPKNHPLFGKQLFLSEKNLEELKNQGFDISLLNPPPSPMWRPHPNRIKDFDTSNYNNDGLLQLRKLYSEEDAQSIINPDYETIVTYKPHKLTGGKTPKFDVLIGKHKWKMKFITNRQDSPGSKSVATEIMKLVWGSEVNVEPAVNNLAAALGFSIDPTYYKKRVRIYFEDKVYKNGTFEKALSEMMKAIGERYPTASNIRSALSVIKTDEAGRKYIETKSVSLEQKSHVDTDLNVGFFDHIGMGRDLAREHRGFLFFLAWVADPDVKNDNVKTKIVPTANGYKVVHSNSDMGGALGIGYPNIYNFPLVKNVTRTALGTTQEIKFNFYRVFEFPMKDAVTLSDAKWFARLLSQLTLNQLEAAFKTAGYPKLVARYYSLLAAKKRNELIEALGLMGTTFTNEQGDVITIEKLPEFTGTIEGFEEFFENDRLTDPENKLFDPQTENWNRHWGVKLRMFSQDSELDKKFHTALKNSIIQFALKNTHKFLDRSIISDQEGFKFINARIIDHELADSCKDDCFVQALDFGFRNFVPVRFIIDNPHADQNPSQPLWLVDLMRIGAFVGDRGEMLQRLIGFDAPESFSTALGSRVFKIFEIIKIKPISGIDEYLNSGKNFLKLPRYAIPGLRDQLIHQLSDNESLIVSNYFGMEAQGRIKPSLTPLSISGIRAGIHTMRVGRVTIHKKPDAFFVNWDKETTAGANASLNLIDILFKVSLVNQNWFAFNKKERTFIFKDNETEKNLLIRHIEKPATEDAELDAHRWEYKHEKSKNRKFEAKIPFWRSYRRSFSKSTTEYKNYLDNVKNNYRRVEIEIEKTKIKGLVDHATFTKNAEALINDAGQVAVTINTKLNYPSTTRSEIMKTLNTERSYFPDSFFYFDLNQMKHYMGKVSAESNIILNQEMLNQLFSDSWSRNSICGVFQKTGCDRRFYEIYSQARTHYKKVLKSGYDVKNRSLKKVIRLFISPEYHSYDFMGFAKTALASASAFSGSTSVLVEHAEMNSSLAAFPGDNDEVSSQKNEPSFGINSALEFFEKPSLFSDKIHEALSSVFFTP